MQRAGMTLGHSAGDAKSSARVRVGKYILGGGGGQSALNVSRIRGEKKNGGNCGKAAYL